MNKYIEYLKLIKKGIENFDNVVEGIITDVRLSHGKLPYEEQEEIIRRRVICKGCPLNSENAKTSEEFNILNNGIPYRTERPDLHCSICACNIDYKTASLSEKCGLQYYNDLNPNNKQPLKWEEFKK